MHLAESLAALGNSIMSESTVETPKDVLLIPKSKESVMKKRANRMGF